jgi:2-polyprenyl-6-methoxyphenol hydroxylase-like FAD-dependent oxidoreductase
VRADYLIGCDGANRVSRAAIGARYVGGTGELPNLNITFSAPALTEDALCARAVHYWVLGAELGGIVGRMDLDGTWWAIAQGVDVRTQQIDPAALVRRLIGADAGRGPRCWTATNPNASPWHGTPTTMSPAKPKTATPAGWQ